MKIDIFMEVDLTTSVRTKSSVVEFRVVSIGNEKSHFNRNFELRNLIQTSAFLGYSYV